MKYLLIVSSILILAVSCSQNEAQGTGVSDDNVTELLESQNYIFRATTAMPARGRTIQLTSSYTLEVKKDSIVSYLPYFGRAYSAPIDRRGGGIEFTSTDFKYNAKRRNNGRYEIEIIPEDVHDVRRIFISISANGYGTLDVTSQNRQAISFNGSATRPER